LKWKREIERETGVCVGECKRLWGIHYDFIIKDGDMSFLAGFKNLVTLLNN
jgi:hypothetical protein